MFYFEFKVLKSKVLVIRKFRQTKSLILLNQKVHLDFLHNNHNIRHGRLAQWKRVWFRIQLIAYPVSCFFSSEM